MDNIKTTTTQSTQVRTYITKTKAGHYCLTVKAMNPWGVMATVCRHRLIDNLTEARRLAAMAKARQEARIG